MRNIGAPEIIVLAVLLIVLFGWKRLPDAARSLGRSARVFKSEVEEMKKDGKDPASSRTVPGEALRDTTSPGTTSPGTTSPGTTAPGPMTDPVSGSVPRDGNAVREDVPLTDDPTRPTP